MILSKFDLELRCQEMLGSLFGGGDLPEFQSIGAPKVGMAGKRASRAAEKFGLIRRAEGIDRQKTILTSGAGDTSPAPVQKVTLLGGTQ